MAKRKRKVSWPPMLLKALQLERVAVKPDVWNRCGDAAWLLNLKDLS